MFGTVRLRESENTIPYIENRHPVTYPSPPPTRDEIFFFRNSVYTTSESGCLGHGLEQKPNFGDSPKLTSRILTGERTALWEGCDYYFFRRISARQRRVNELAVVLC